MDLTGLSSIYTDYMKTQSDNQKLEKMKADWKEKQKGTDDEQLLDACKQFESYFVEQMFKEMQKTVPETEYSFKSTGTMVDYYRDSMIQEMASLSTETGGLGLAQMLYEQMKINNGSEA
ncbi:MAG: rod-binding protein [Lachnospiraceae bacterium]|nr:rod-binding protein [Lachnospiraceae bacterium]